jgi:dipeptidyl aminopeptidase/acylaminoacyl peptidase
MFRALLLLFLAFAALARPSAAASGPPPLEAYGRLPALELMSLSPSGDKFAFVATEGDQRKVFIRKVGGDALAVTSVGDLKVRDLLWAGEDRVLIFVNVVVGQGYRLDLLTTVVFDIRTGKAFRVFEKTPGVFDAVSGYYGWAELDGRSYAYFGGLGTGVSWEESLYQVDLASGETRRLARAGAQGVRWLLDDGGRIIARNDWDPVKSEYRVYGGAAGANLVYAKVTPLVEAGLEGRGRTPGTVVVSDSTGPEKVIQEVDLSGAKPPERLFAGKEVAALAFHPQTRLLIGAELTRDGGMAFADARLQARYDSIRKALPGRQLSLMSIDAQFDRAIVFTSGPDDSGCYWLADLKRKTVEPIGQAYPAIPGEQVAPVATVAYTAADGLPIEAVLTLPRERPSAPLPLVVLPHGGPIGIYDKAGFDWIAQAFASRGYAVLQPNFRGSGGYGLSFERKGLGEWGRRMQTDLSDGVQALAAKGVIDPGRVCIVGGSYGGYAALAGVTLQKGVYRCAVAYAGVSDLAAMLYQDGDVSMDPSPLIRFMRVALGASWKGDPALRTLSPIRAANAASAPILLIHGKDDTVVPVEQSRAMAYALKRAGAQVDYEELPGEDHFLSREATRVRMLKSAVAFVMRHNPPSSSLDVDGYVQAQR